MVIDYQHERRVRATRSLRGPCQGQGGGRNIGEACHIYDLFTYLTGARVERVDAQAIRPATGYYMSSDNFIATVRFEDGSIATLTYTAIGSPAVPKERMDVYCDGIVLQLEDYRRLSIAGSPGDGLTTSTSEKGQREELEDVIRVIRDGGDWPVSLWEQSQATEIAFCVQTRIAGSDA